MPGVPPSNRRLRAAKNVTNYGAPYGGFGFGNPARIGTSYHSFRLFSRIKPTCCGTGPEKIYSYSKCCNDPKLRATITTKALDNNDNNGADQGGPPADNNVTINTARFRLNNLIVDMMDVDGTNEHISFIHVHDLKVDDTIIFVHPNTGANVETVITQVIEDNGRKIGIRIADTHNSMGNTDNMTVIIVKA